MVFEPTIYTNITLSSTSVSKTNIYDGLGKQKIRDSSFYNVAKTCQKACMGSHIL
jgi:hypothetical protein